MTKTTKTTKTQAAGTAARREARKPGKAHVITPASSLGKPEAFASKPAEKTVTPAKPSNGAPKREKIDMAAVALATARDTVRPFMRREQAESLRDHKHDQTWLRVAATIESMPLTGDIRAQGVQQIARMQYLKGRSCWYITELDRDGDGNEQAYGWWILDGDTQQAGMGDICISALCNDGAELCLGFKATQLVELQAAHLRAASTPAASALPVETPEDVERDFEATLREQMIRDGATEKRVQEVLAYERRVRAYEAEGMTRSDAQGVVDAEDAGMIDKGVRDQAATLGVHVAASEVDEEIEQASTPEAKPEVEALPPTTAVQVRVDQLRAALICAASGDIRGYLNSVKLHRTADGDVRMVATDGHRMLVQGVQLEHLPEWLNDGGVQIASDELREAIPMLAKHGDAVTLEFGAGHSHVTMRSADGFCQFRAYVQPGQFPDYQRILNDVDLSNRGGDVLEAAHVNPAYVKGAADVAKALGSKSIQAFAGSADRASSFLFGPEHPAVVMIVMPMRSEAKVTQATAALLGSSLVASVGALRAHLTRTTEALKKAKKEKADAPVIAKLEEKLAGYQARIDELLAVTSKALPAPAKA